MTHPRKAIRDAVVSLLTAAGTAAGSNVFASSSWALAGEDLPAIIVWTPGDARWAEGSADGDGHIDLGAAHIDRAVDVRIEARVKQASGADDALDALCREIELAMAGDLDLSGNALFQLYDDTEITATEDQGVQGMLAVLNYRAVRQDDWS